MSKAFQKLVERNNATGLAKWVKGRKTAPVREIAGAVPALDDECLVAIAPLLSPGSQAEVVRRLLASPSDAGRFLSAGCEFGFLMVGLMSSADHIQLFIDSGWDPTNLTYIQRGHLPRDWAIRDEAFHRALFDAGVPLSVEHLAQLIVHRGHRKTSADHFALLCSHLPAGDAERSFDPIRDVANLADAAAVYLGCSALEHALSLGSPPPTVPISPGLPDAEEKTALLEGRGTPAKRFGAKDFSQKHTLTRAEIMEFLGPEYALGLRPGMSKAEVEATGLAEGSHGNTSLEFDDHGLLTIRVSVHEAEGWGDLVDALSDHFGPPSRAGHRSVWKTDLGVLTLEALSNPTFETYTFVLERRGDGDGDEGSFPGDLAEFRSAVESYLQDVGPDTLGGRPDAVQVFDERGALRVEYSLLGETVFLSWPDGPCTAEGGLTRAFQSALLRVGSHVQMD